MELVQERVKGSEGVVITHVDGKIMLRVYLLNARFHALLMKPDATVKVGAVFVVCTRRWRGHRSLRTQELLHKMAHFLEMEKPEEHGRLFSLHTSKDGKKSQSQALTPQCPPFCPRVLHPCRLSQFPGRCRWMRWC